MDGVLIDTAEFHKQSWYDLAELKGYQMSDEFFNHTFGMQNYQVIPQLAEREMSDEEIYSLEEWKENRFRELIDKQGKLPLMEGVGELITSLKQNGFKLAIGTSTTAENLKFLLEHMPVHGEFDALVSSEDVEHSKPEPDTFLKAAEKLQLSPQDCIVVEDAIIGVQAGKAGCMKVIAVATTWVKDKLQQADIVFDKPGDIKVSDFERLLNS
jgi:HAD superfamily hydrolase (TIGR01509 family)